MIVMGNSLIIIKLKSLYHKGRLLSRASVQFSRMSTPALPRAVSRDIGQAKHINIDNREPLKNHANGSYFPRKGVFCEKRHNFNKKNLTRPFLCAKIYTIVGFCAVRTLALMCDSQRCFCSASYNSPSPLDGAIEQKGVYSQIWNILILHIMSIMT